MEVITHIAKKNENKNGPEKRYFVTTIVLTYYVKKLFWWSKKLLKFEAEDQEFLRSLEQFIRTVKGQNAFWLVPGGFRYKKLEQLEFILEKKILEYRNM